jgi:hypothetical protein
VSRALVSAFFGWIACGSAGVALAPVVVMVLVAGPLLV